MTDTPLFHREANLLNLAIADLAPHVSSTAKTGGLYKRMFTLRSTLNQAITILAEGAREPTFAVPFTLDTYLIAIGSVTAQIKVDTLTNPWRYVRYTATAPGPAPGAGTLTIDFDGE